MEVLYGVHPVSEALRARPDQLDHVSVAREREARRDGRLERVLELCRTAGVRVDSEPREQLTRYARTDAHQGVVAFVRGRTFLSLDDLLEASQANAGGRFLLALDGVEDPHNLGAIARTALAAGADGVVIPERRAAGLTETVERVSAGALAHLPVVRVKNLARVMEQLKEAGFWLVGLDEHAPKLYSDIDYKGRVAIVMGSEGTGLHELIRKNCDFLVSIPTTGPVRSLNVSVAAGVVLFEAVRQRKQAAR